MTLVDTSSWIEFLRGRKSETGLRVKELVRTERAAWCDLIAVELWNGARPGDETKFLTELDNAVTCFELNKPVWLRARKLAAASRKNGITVPMADIVIATCAIHYRLEMEYIDGHFDRILAIAAKL